MPTSPTSEQRGFTLFEVLVALGVLVLAASLCLPRLGDQGGLEADAAARRLAGALTLARERAVLGGRPIVVSLDLDAGRWTIEGTPEDPSAGALPPRVRLRAVTVDGATVRLGTVRLDLDPAGDALPVHIELSDRHGRPLAVVLPPAGGPARVEREAHA